MRYIRRAAGFFVLVVVVSALGAVADAYHLSGPSHLAAIVAGLASGVTIVMLVRAYAIGVRIPSLGRQLTAMMQAVDAGLPVSGRFWAGLRDLAAEPPSLAEGNGPGSRVTLPRASQRPRLGRWMSGRVVITPESVIWVRRMTGRARDLTGAEWTGERRLDPGYRESTLVVPTNYREFLAVITLHVDDTDVELVTHMQLLEILRYSLARARGLAAGH